MLPNPSRLDDSHTNLVIDASVTINLLGTGVMPEVVQVLGRKIHMERRAREEVIKDPFTQRPANDALAPMESRGALVVVDLPSKLMPQFVAFASSGAANGLEDGEAATIVLAHHLNAVAVLDEERAIKAAAAHYPGVPVITSVDLLAAPAVFSRLGKDRVSDLFFAACRHARMRVGTMHAAWVVKLIGARAAECASIRKHYRTGEKQG